MWKTKPKHSRVKIGEPAGCLNAEDRRVVKINKVVYFTNRLIWMWHHGTDPGELEVDHIDENKSNEHISNLQLLTGRENIEKRGEGVYKKNKKWAAEVRINGKRHYLGVYETRDEAVVAARKQRQLVL